LHLFAGEECWGLRARASWNKSDALLQILAHLQLSAADLIYVGEAFTDDDVFRGNPDALTFCVGGDGESPARFRLSGAEETSRFLSCIAAALKECPGGSA
jgi:hypothetical protein